MKFLIIGLGSMGKRRIRNLFALGFNDVIGFDTRSDRRKESELKYQEIVNSINEIGFINTASVYSVSDTSKYGGDIGWVNERQLTKNINEGIKKLNIGEVSKAIVVPGGVLVLKINDKKKEDLNIDKDDMLKKQIAFEKNKQFNQFSLIYYNKIKFNAKVDEK